MLNGQMTKEEYEKEIMLKFIDATSPLRTIRDLTKIVAKENVPLQIDDSYSLFCTIDECLKKIDDIIFIV